LTMRRLSRTFAIPRKGGSVHAASFLHRIAIEPPLRPRLI
jgi:hypothetical protein